MFGRSAHTIETFSKLIRKKKSGCWHFTGPLSKQGYGKVGFHGKVLQAHRLSWIFFRGIIPEGLLVLHKCDNPKCVNPDHLWIGTHRDNSLDMVKKGRHGGGRAKSNLSQKEFCVNGHKTSEYAKIQKNGQWYCRKCNLIRINAKNKLKFPNAKPQHRNLKNGLCRNGHLLNDDNIFLYATGQIVCKQCKKIKQDLNKTP